MLNKEEPNLLLVRDLDAISAYARPLLSTGNSNRRFLDTLSKAVHHAIDQELTARQRQCFLLRYEEGLSNEEAARLLGVKESTVSYHIAQARRKVYRYARYCLLAFQEEQANWLRSFRRK